MSNKQDIINIRTRREQSDYAAGLRMLQTGRGVGVVAGSESKRARCQENIPASGGDGKISVKLLDASNAVTGAAFDVWMFTNRRTAYTITALAVPAYGTDLSGKDVWIDLDSVTGEWYLRDNTIVVRGTC